MDRHTFLISALVERDWIASPVHYLREQSANDDYSMYNSSGATVHKQTDRAS
jgi:hypothetical protein